MVLSTNNDVKFFCIPVFGYDEVMREALQLWLSHVLNRRNLSHNELARQTGFSRPFVSNIALGY